MGYHGANVTALFFMPLYNGPSSFRLFLPQPAQFGKLQLSQIPSRRASPPCLFSQSGFMHILLSCCVPTGTLALADCCCEADNFGVCSTVLDNFLGIFSAVFVLSWHVLHTHSLYLDVWVRSFSGRGVMRHTLHGGYRCLLQCHFPLLSR